jgi:hypothetical protein
MISIIRLPSIDSRSLANYLDIKIDKHVSASPIIPSASPMPKYSAKRLEIGKKLGNKQEISN